MKACMLVAQREMKVGLRNPWAYSFLVLFSVFLGSLLLINAKGYVSGYSGMTSTILNLVLHLLPLMALMLGSFSLAGEKEDGHWELLATYPIGIWSYLAGKFLGLAAALFIITAFGFGFAGVLGWMAGSALAFRDWLLLLVFSCCLTVFFLAVSMVTGAAANNRWQALTMSVALWFVWVIAWAPLLIGILGMLPFGWVKPAITALTLLNPAELARLFVIVKLGGGSVAGPEYYEWMQWVHGSAGTIGLCAWLMIWIAGGLALSRILWERRTARG